MTRTSSGLPEKIDGFLWGLLDRVGANPLYKKWVRDYWYPGITKASAKGDRLFLNFGYEEVPPMGLPLEPADEPNRLWIQLYHVTASQMDIGGKDVLEVSCGHGGGASYLVRTFHPSSYTGLDFNPEGIAFCQKRYDLPGLSFVHGDAENLPFPDASFDALVNVEASHAYSNFERFLREVARVLRPGGHFLYGDLRRNEEIKEWDEALAAFPLRLVAQRDITPGIVRALEINSPRLNEEIDRDTPAYLRFLSRELAHVAGSRSYRDMERGHDVFRTYCFTKD